ncbi:MAG: hypothetical protein ACRD4Y_04615 [Candidatus Acidiferrales bacterium]
MPITKQNTSTPPYNLASLIRGLYGRVARRLEVDPSYVSRVARGERQSEEIEACLEKELRRIMRLMKSGQNGASRNGSGSRGAKSARRRAGKKVKA